MGYAIFKPISLTWFVDKALTRRLFAKIGVRIAESIALLRVDNCTWAGLAACRAGRLQQPVSRSLEPPHSPHRDRRFCIYSAQGDIRTRKKDKHRRGCSLQCWVQIVALYLQLSPITVLKLHRNKLANMYALQVALPIVIRNCLRSCY